jgi:general secretion pathway protein L
MASRLRDLTAAAARKAPEAALIIPESLALRRPVALPAAASENLREVLSFEMDRLTPFKAPDIYYDFRALPRSGARYGAKRGGGAEVRFGQQLRVDLLVVCRSDVDWALDLARGAGLKPEWLEVADQRDDPAFNLLPVTSESVHRKRYRTAAALAGIACALVAARISLPLYQLQASRDRLETEVAEARGLAAESGKLRDDLDEAVRRGRQLHELKRRTPASIAILDEVTRVLPDGTWLNSLDLRDGALSLSGYSAKASALIALLEDSDLLEEVQFRSQVTFDQKSGAERFSISARITEGSAIAAALPEEE